MHAQWAGHGLANYRADLKEDIEIFRWLKNKEDSLCNSLWFRVYQWHHHTTKCLIEEYKTNVLIRKAALAREVAFKRTTLIAVIRPWNMRDGEDCIICLQRFKWRDHLQQCPQCKKSFHDLCMYRSLIRQLTCPLCRFELKKDKGQGIHQQS